MFRLGGRSVVCDGILWVRPSLDLEQVANLSLLPSAGREMSSS